MSDESAETGLVDVGGLTLADLDGLNESALSHALRALLQAGEDAMGPIAGFSQSIDGVASGS
ncbi:FXSXX-COOH protein [Nonomuraea sp. KC401]|uniref:FXSXX-COOH protein n=1 Tax=Nonomuraea longispora TaxID=1848320 RepID=A0A4V2XJX9_9ACTN|nr:MULTISPECIES: FxSxx-COOH cyclophane-containing RiPP peptide [Nonomuraea]NBE92239.1 FXSXX-COOH protein [Nonomuraea sp. K271]TDC04276.1 FXSXX-COOH protein [Nonomuraea longispora]TLF68258.1 FXSXX-COOH protein [Nonomuraea sp. KC401]